jgi:hypothetical protein
MGHSSLRLVTLGIRSAGVHRPPWHDPNVAVGERGAEDTPETATTALDRGLLDGGDFNPSEDAMLAFWMFLAVGGCGQSSTVTDADCADDETFVADYCTRCGDAGGCAEQGPACVAQCSDTGSVTCVDGLESPACD